MPILQEHELTILPTPETGCLLIAHPIIEDPHFFRSVVLLCEYQEDGVYGLILNRPLSQTLKDVMNDTSLEGLLFEGGPVRRDSLHILHRIGPTISGSKNVKENLYWGGELEEFAEHIATKQAQLNDIRFCAGYSGWSKEQLLTEIKIGGWILVRSNLSFLFDIPADLLWKTILKKIGGEYYSLAYFPVHPSLN